MHRFTGSGRVYEDELILTASNAEEIRVPILINVGAEHLGTAVFEVRNSKQTALKDITVELTGPEFEEGQQAVSRVYSAATADGSETDGLSESDRQGKLLGQVRFNNIPAGLYTVRVFGKGISPYTATADIPAVVNLKEQIITVSEMSFIFDFNAEAIMNAESSAITAGNYAGALYEMKNNSYANKQTGIVPNFPGDEAEFYYRRPWLEVEWL